MRGPICRGALLALAGLTLLGSGGCRRQERVSHYRVPKEHVLLAENGPEPGEALADAAKDYRMLAAIVPRGEQAWFFRMMGPAEAVAAEADRFRELVASVRFAAADAPPEWTLPSGWRQLPASGMRYATIDIEASAGALDLSVTMLPRGEPDLDVYTLSNVNRWRGQLGLPTIGAAELKDQITQVALADGSATLVDLLGRKPKDSMSRAPFAGGPMPNPRAPAAQPTAPIGRAASQPTAPRAPAAREPMAAPLSYDVPAGWTETEAGGMRTAAFAIVDGGQKAEVTVISLDGAGGALLPNINRWRGQIQLPETTSEELAATVKQIEVGPLKGEYVELIGPEKGILGVVVAQGGHSWFFKLTGEVPLVNREKENFEKFVRSVRFAGGGE